jgi:hypothetical protein
MSAVRVAINVSCGPPFRSPSPCAETGVGVGSGRMLRSLFRPESPAHFSTGTDSRLDVTAKALRSPISGHSASRVI